jgi:hypothetical protein
MEVELTGVVAEQIAAVNAFDVQSLGISWESRPSDSQDGMLRERQEVLADVPRRN